MASSLLEALAPHLPSAAASAMAASSSVARRVANRAAAFPAAPASSVFYVYALGASDEEVAAVRRSLAEAARRAALHAVSSPVTTVPGAILLPPLAASPRISFSTAPTSSALNAYALGVSDEVVATVRGSLAAAARRAALHAVSSLGTTVPGCILLTPLGASEWDPASPLLASALASPRAPLHAAASPDGRFLLAPMGASDATAPRLPSASSSTTRPGKDDCSSAMPGFCSSSCSMVLLGLYATDWVRGALGPDPFSSAMGSPCSPLTRVALIAPGTATSPRLVPRDLAPLLPASCRDLSSSSAPTPSGLLVLLESDSMRLPLLMGAGSRAPLRTSIFPACHTIRFFYSTSDSPRKGPGVPPPAKRDAQFLISMMRGMVLDDKDGTALRKAVDKMFPPACACEHCTFVENVISRLQALEDGLHQLSKDTKDSRELILKKLSNKPEWGSIKVFGRKLDLSKLFVFVRGLIALLMGGS